MISDELMMDDNIEERIKVASYELWRHLRLKENLLRQKSIQKWSKEGTKILDFPIQS